VVGIAGEVVLVVARRIEVECLNRGDGDAGGVGQLERRHRGQRRLVVRSLVAHLGARPGGGGDQLQQRFDGAAHRRVAEGGFVPHGVGHALHTLGRAHRDRGGGHHPVGALGRHDLDQAGRRVVERRRQPEGVDDRRRLPHVVGPLAPGEVGPVPEPVGARGQVAVGVEVVGAALVVGQLVGVRHLIRARPARQDPCLAGELQVSQLVVLQPAGLGRIDQVRPARRRVDPLETGDTDERAADAPARAPAGAVDAAASPFLLPVQRNRHLDVPLAIHRGERHRHRELAGAFVDLAAEAALQGEPPAGRWGRCLGAAGGQRLRQHREPGKGEDRRHRGDQRQGDRHDQSDAGGRRA
jgi:hypothetical protein